MYTLSASVLDDARNDYKSVDFLRNNLFSIKGDYVLLAGCGRIINSPALAEVTARRKANHQIIKLKELEIDTEKFNPELKSLFRSNLFLQYRIFCNIKYTAKNMITVASYIHKNYCYFACAYKLSDIEFVPNYNLDLNRVYNILKQADNRRNEFIFYEIIPENELSALKNAVENNIAQRYGKNFAAMFFGQTVKVGTQKQFEEIKAAYAGLSQESSLQELLTAANKLPYDSRICILLADKFKQLQMPRCSEMMQTRASQSGNLIFSPEVEKTESSEETSINTEKNIEKKNKDTVENAQREAVDQKDKPVVKNVFTGDVKDLTATDVKKDCPIVKNKKSNSRGSSKSAVVSDKTDNRKSEKKKSTDKIENINVIRLL